MRAKSPAAQLAGFLAKFTPEVAASARAALARMRKRLPGAIELVYDNYNALAIGFGPTERASDAVFSIAVFPRWVSLFFLQSGTELPDPNGLLKGTGTRVRHIVLESPADLDTSGGAGADERGAGARGRAQSTAPRGIASSSSRCRRNSDRACRPHVGLKRTGVQEIRSCSFLRKDGSWPH